MAMVALPGLWPLPSPDYYGTQFGDLLIDASGEKAAAIIQPPKTGNIDRVLFKLNTVTSAQTLKIGVETVTTGGAPSGSAYGGSGTVTQASPATGTQYEVTLGTAASVTDLSQLMAIVVEFNTTAGNLNVAAWGNTLNSGIPYSALFTASWARSVSVPAMAVRYDDGSYYDCGTIPASGTNTYAHAANTAGFDEYAFCFTLPFAARIAGAWQQLVTSSSSDYEVTLYSGTTALKTMAVDGDMKGGTGAAITRVRFDSPYDLVANTQYRVSFRPTTNNQITTRTWAMNQASYMNALPLGTAGFLSKRLDLGAWTDVTTERPLMGLLIDAIDVGGGAGIARLVGKGLVN